MVCSCLWHFKIHSRRAKVITESTCINVKHVRQMRGTEADYDGFVDYGCCHLGAWGNVAVILHFFRPVCRPWGGWQGWSRTWSWAVALTLTITTLFTTTVRGNVTLIVDALKNNHCIDQPLTQKSYNIIVSFPRMIWKVFRYQEVQTIFRLRQPYWTIWRP